MISCKTALVSEYGHVQHNLATLIFYTKLLKHLAIAYKILFTVVILKEMSWKYTIFVNWLNKCIIHGELWQLTIY